jgi:hypothetical protein
MGRTKGATNKPKQPAISVMTEEQRVNLLAELLLELITEEQAKR